MAFEEKRAWVMIVVSVSAYTIYVATVLSRAGNGPLTDVAYTGTLVLSSVLSSFAKIMAYRKGGFQTW
ncbi:hypothetical protein OG339_16930 [Streptosporangium sp. NBC_01495]|uniref:hypothetical protein n=1 Tax=Streptosporangium sp. NBC_01495 TaxID=2903899 RepID=UPI002E35796F|nr:hypothetical protein [Streptosporangium sp. NBC_01495]